MSGAKTITKQFHSDDFFKEQLKAMGIQFSNDNAIFEFFDLNYLSSCREERSIANFRKNRSALAFNFGGIKLNLILINDKNIDSWPSMYFPEDHWQISLSQNKALYFEKKRTNMDLNTALQILKTRRFSFQQTSHSASPIFELAHRSTIGFEHIEKESDFISNCAYKFLKNKYSRLNVEGFKKDYHNYLKERSTLKVVKTEKSIRNVRLNFDQDSELFNEKFVPTGSHLEKLFYCLNLLSILIDVPEEPSEDPNYRDQIKAKWKENCSLQKLQRKTSEDNLKAADWYCKMAAYAWQTQSELPSLSQEYFSLIINYPEFTNDLLTIARGLFIYSWILGQNKISAYSFDFSENEKTPRLSLSVIDGHETFHLSLKSDPLNP